MRLVTELIPEPRSGGVRVQLDGTPFGTIGAGDLLELALVVGRELDEAATSALAARADRFAARGAVLRLLATRPLPSGEIVRRLVRKGMPRSAVQEAVAVLRDGGLIDDLEFARHYARTRVGRRRVGPVRLVADLRRMGLEQGEAQAAVREALEADGVDPRDVLRRAAQRKLLSLAGVSPALARRRLRAYLLRRGFDPSDVRAVVKEALKG